MTPEEFGTILARFDLLPCMTPEVFAKLASTMFDFVDFKKDQDLRIILEKIPNMEN